MRRILFYAVAAIALIAGLLVSFKGSPWGNVWGYGLIYAALLFFIAAKPETSDE